MEQTNLSHGAPVGASATRNRKLMWARIAVLTLLLALGVFSVQPTTSAHVAGQAVRAEKASLTGHQLKAKRGDCADCQQAYVQCLASGGGAFCDIQFNACIENCQ